MSTHIKRQIEILKDNIYLLERECDELYYEVYVCCRERWLPQYEFTLKGLDEQFDELKRLEKMYEIELSKERCKRADESYKQAKEELYRAVERLVHLENEKMVKEEKEVEHIEEAAIKDSTEEGKQVTEDPIKVVNDIIEVEHIDFIIPEYLPKSQSLAYQFSKFFAPRLFFKRSMNFILVPSHHSCVVLDFYKTRGRVFSNKGRMMRNGNKQLI